MEDKLIILQGQRSDSLFPIKQGIFNHYSRVFFLQIVATFETNLFIVCVCSCKIHP